MNTKTTGDYGEEKASEFLKNQGYSDEESQKILEDKIRRSFEGITLDKNNALFQITGIRELLIWMEQHVMPKQKTR